MAKKYTDTEMLNWLKSHPDVYEKLKQMRDLEAGDPHLDKAELELLELVKAMGASSFQRILQQKSETAEQLAKDKATRRTHGKKN
jgi:hypothetical protein